jgi:hypothetical protein
VHAHEAPAIEPGLQCDHCFTVHVPACARVQEHVIATGFYPIDILHCQQAQLAVRAAQKKPVEMFRTFTVLPGCAFRPSAFFCEAVEPALQCAAKPILVERLQKVIGSLRIERRDCMFSVRGYEDGNRHILGAHRVYYIESGSATNLHIEKKQVGLESEDSRWDFVATFAFAHGLDVTFAAQQSPDVSPSVRLVINNESTCWQWTSRLVLANDNSGHVETGTKQDSPSFFRDETSYSVANRTAESTRHAPNALRPALVREPARISGSILV